ncbi:MAG TPA: caspase family protein [Pyrinomonadaceae bacterium]|nr:caspase family protein [Pyrinomonadaceae bacterium]
MSDEIPKPNKRALLVGINEYPNLPDYSQLRGCVNDVQVMSNLLETLFGFTAENITVLVNEQATEKGIREAMEKLAADCAEGDIIVFHYSGHGSQMAARGDKPRGYDESIMPYDSGRMNPVFPKQVEPRDIRDTQIQEWLSRLTRKTPYITLIFDSCHSGSITRLVGDSEEEGTRLRWIPPDPLPPRSPRPTGSPEGHEPALETGASGWLPLNDKYVLLAACAAEQGAYELDHETDGKAQRNGAFTFFLAQEISLAADQNACTYMDIWERVALKVNNRFKKQTPQIEGTRNRQIFSVQDFVPMPYLLVQERQGSEVQLNGGAVHGLTVGSHWEIYPAGTKKISETKEERQGRVEITTVSPVSARARVLEENSSQPITPNARAVEVLHADHETLMPVRFAPPPPGYEGAVAEMRQALSGSRLLKITDSAAEARVEVRVVVPHATAKPGDISPQGQASAEAVWNVVDRSETPLMSQRAVAAPESKHSIKENLETIWRYNKVLELRNDQSTLKGKVEFDLLKKGADGTWRTVAQGDEEAVYRHGEPIAFRVANRSEKPVYASVLDFGLSKQIDVLYPSASASEEISVKRSGGDSTQTQLGGVLSVGEKPGDELELYFPENLTFLAQPDGGSPARGKEYFKLVVTTQRHDLSFLRQSGLRTELSQEPEHPLERLTYLAVTSGLEREVLRKLEPQDEWFTIERAFWLQHQ